jgi:hypothetical protein
VNVSLLPRRDVTLGVLPYYHIYGTRRHRHIFRMFTNASQRRRGASVPSPFLQHPRGHPAQIRS